MPAATYYQPIESILNGNCNYEYYIHTDKKFTKDTKSRICHIELPASNDYNKDIVLLIYTIRKQNDAWKIHSEGAKRTDPGAMVPLRNAAISLAKEKGWKFASVAVTSEDAPVTETISHYVVSIESYSYGNETVGVLTDALEKIEEQGNPDFYRAESTIGNKHYSLAFVKKETLLEYLKYTDARSFNDDTDEEDDIFNHSLYGIHIKLQNDALSDTNPHVCIGWSKMGDLSATTTREELDSSYESAYPNEKPRKKGQDLGQIWRFTQEMQIGDYVVFSQGDICHIGRIVSDYYFDNAPNANQDVDYVNIRDVEWLKKDIRKSDLSEVFQNSLGAAMSVFRLNDYKSAIYELLNGTYVKDEFIPDETERLVDTDDVPNNLTVSELGKLLTDMYNACESKTAAIHMFAIKYAEAIKNCGAPAADIVKHAGISESYHAEVSKGLRIYESISNNEFGIHFVEEEEIELVNYNFDSPITTAENRVFYGTPGCGKSYHVENTFLKKIGVPAENRIRTTFYQDYTNTDFVGQILPKVHTDKSVTYEFNPGPFALAMKKAIASPDVPVALIIEELNRGSAPSIFGDIFQLLDRNDNGCSVYGITNVNLQDYLNREFAKDGYSFSNIKIPGNLYIIATMNTSDQNVFTLDTAFKRRWKFEKLPNLFTADHEYKDYFVPGMGDITWESLVISINDFIVSQPDDITAEDKQLGVYFIGKDCLCEKQEDCTEQKKKEFAYKLFEYLWDDVAKFAHSDWFGNVKTLDQLIDDFLAGKKVFVDGIIKN